MIDPASAEKPDHVNGVTVMLEPRGEGEVMPVLLAPDRESLDYAVLRRFVLGIAGGLRSVGIEPEDRIALVTENGPEAATAFLSIASAAVAAPLNPAYRARELAFYLEDIGARGVIVSETLDTPVREVAAARGIQVIELRVDPFNPAGIFTLDGVESGTPLETKPDPGEVALVLHTSGTTSRPKLVPLTHRQLSVSAQNVVLSLRLVPSDRCLNVMPLFHVHGLVTALLASLHAGASVVCSPGFHQLRFFDWLDELKPTWYTAVPTMHAAVLSRAPDHQEAVAQHGLRFVRSASAALPVSVLEGLEATFQIPVIEAYGMTEAAHLIASNPLPPDVRRPRTVGRAAGPEVCILDDSGRVLASGEVGEVAIRGENVFSGYETNPDANELSFSGDWFRTGDQGFLDEDGFLTLDGRIKEIINRGGEKFSPIEVDNVLMRHAAVTQAVTFAMPDPRLGEEVAAAVVLAPGSDSDERDLQSFASAELAPFKVPRRIVFVEELPGGPTGKIQRIGLAERLRVGSSGDPAVSRLPYRFLERELISIWESVLGIPGLGVGDDFFALGGDSILGAEAVTRVRDLVGDPDLPLVSIVRAPTPAAMASEVFTGVGIGHSGAIPLQAAGDRRPLFLVHPGDGEVLSYPLLARRLGPDQPSYGLRAQGLDDGAPMHSSFAEMATQYLSDVRREQPHGPYALGGYCIGGAIAAEMASQLRAAGEEVAMLILLDPRFRRPAGVRYDMWLALRRARERRLAHSVVRRIARKGARLAPAAVKAVGSTDVATSLESLRESHAPRPMAVPTTVLLSEEFEQFDLPTYYLKNIVRRPVRWRQFSCAHAHLLLPPTVDEVAGEIRAALERTVV